MEEQQSDQINGGVYNTIVHFPDPYFAESFMQDRESGQINMTFSSTELTYEKEDLVNAIKKYMFDSGVQFVSRRIIEEEAARGYLRDGQQADAPLIFFDTRNFASTLLRNTFGRVSYNFGDLTNDAQYGELLTNVKAELLELYAKDYIRPFVGGPKPGEVTYIYGDLRFSESSRVKVISGQANPQEGYSVDAYRLKLFVPASPLFTVDVQFNLGPIENRREFAVRESTSSRQRRGERSQSPRRTSETTRARDARLRATGRAPPSRRQSGTGTTSGRRTSSRQQQQGQRRTSSRQQQQGQGQRGRVTNPGGRGGVDGLGYVVSRSRSRSSSPGQQSPRSGGGQRTSSRRQTTGRRQQGQQQPQVQQQPQQVQQQQRVRRTRTGIQQQPQLPQQPIQPVEEALSATINTNGSLTISNPSSPRVSPRRVGNGNGGNGRSASPRRVNGSPRQGTGNGGNGRSASPRRVNGSPRRVNGSPRQGTGNGNNGNDIDLDATVASLLGDDF